MNEFTKEELKQLLFAIDTYPHADDDHIYEGLRNKIKAMIDNYCEHEWNYNQHGIPCDCEKCGKNYR